MNNQQAYDEWAKNYDAVENKTRDLEARALRESVAGAGLDVLELGCGTGKNTEYLLARARRLVGVDFSAAMLARARAKIKSEAAEFRQSDLRERWNFREKEFDLIACSLALEHVADLDFVFGEARRVLRPGGLFYVGELHPFKQYQGSKARFDTGGGVFELECFTHHVSDFLGAAAGAGFGLTNLKEWFDEDDRTGVPRLLTMAFRAG